MFRITTKICLYEGREVHVPVRCPFHRCLSDDKDGAIIQLALAVAEIGKWRTDSRSGWPSWAVLSFEPLRLKSGMWNYSYMRQRINFVMYNWEYIEVLEPVFAEEMVATLRDMFNSNTLDDAFRSAQRDAVGIKLRHGPNCLTPHQAELVGFFCSAYAKMRYPTPAELVEEAYHRLESAGWSIDDVDDTEEYSPYSIAPFDSGLINVSNSPSGPIGGLTLSEIVDENGSALSGPEVLTRLAIPGPHG